MYKYTVSIITPVYNTEKFLDLCIQSVQSQTFEDWEMILIDDCSSDNSVEIALNYSKKDDRIKVLKFSANRGPAEARNKGIEISSGRYISFLDSDDLWRADKLEKQIKFMQKKDCELSYTHYSKIDENGNDLGHKISAPAKIKYTDLLKANYIGCLTAMYDSKKIGKVYMPNISKRQDYGLWLKILKEIDYAYCLPESLAFYRVSSSSISSSKMNLVKYNLKLFNEIEGFSKIKSFYYLSWNILIKLLGNR